MIWVKIAGVSLVLAMIVKFEWLRLNQGHTRERATLIILAAMGWVAALLVILFPEMPGPIMLIDWLYRPLAGLIS
ncbi:hypothetical protein [Paenibacillus pabuli]|uniref:hypothetical protein n=1 Tax=Paenibacillus pabuli TaxID=1472 RepID=UPI001FFF109E|nr:hypothetical protein [Paenibacillus pabuli]UPK41333.1 hypothetical protein KET34_18810 [Paenibacillus pabuli]